MKLTFKMTVKGNESFQATLIMVWALHLLNEFCHSVGEVESIHIIHAFAAHTDSFGTAK